MLWLQEAATYVVVDLSSLYILAPSWQNKSDNILLRHRIYRMPKGLYPLEKKKKKKKDHHGFNMFMVYLKIAAYLVKGVST